MTMTFSLHENFEFNGVEICNEVASTSLNRRQSFSDEVRLFAEKLAAPKARNSIRRPRLLEVLSKSCAQFGATLITGRAGTGKTTLAAQFARKYKKTAWFSMDSADSEWKIFSAYFSASLKEPRSKRSQSKNSFEDSAPDQSEISNFVENLLAEFCPAEEGQPNLIVLDDAHYIFDSDWFGDFFNTLIYSLSGETHLLMLSRGTPSLPLWRLRSKQVLGVVDEKLLAFDLNETRKLFQKSGCPVEAADQAHAKSFGRISRLKSLIEKC
jgi:LuxR family maltose regulon positive regulatory protein